MLKAKTAPELSIQSRSDRHLHADSHISVLAFTGIFLVALATRIWFNFICPHNNAAFSCDAAEYLRNAQTLATLQSLSSPFWWQAAQVLAGTASTSTVTQVHTALAGFSDFFISGPVFPIFLLLCYTIAGTACDISNWAPPVAAQCFLTAITCVLIARTGALCWSKQEGITAGLVAALYPGFIINSGRLYSESFACFLLCLSLCLTVEQISHAKAGGWSSFVNGATALSLQLTRSVMFIYSLALIPLTWLANRESKPFRALAVFTAGCAAIALPWLAFQQLAFGHGSLVVDRVGHYNFFTGNNVNAQGWLSYPYPDMSGIESKSFVRLAKESIKQSPSRWLSLALGKPARLWKFPWNDFRTDIGCFRVRQLIVVHQLIVFMALLGVAIALFTELSKVGKWRKLSCRLLVLALGLLHGIYLAFITVPRYNTTGMPMLVLFAAAGALAINRLMRAKASRSTGIFILCAALFFFFIEKSDLYPYLLPLCGTGALTLALCLTAIIKLSALSLVAATCWKAIATLPAHKLVVKVLLALLVVGVAPSVCLPLRVHNRWWEWSCPLTASGQSIRQIIPLAPGQINAMRDRQAYLLIDSNSAESLNNGVRIKVNGHYVEPLVLPNLPFLQDLRQFKTNGSTNLYLECEYIFECLTYPAGIDNLSLRQWFLIPLPEETAKKCAEDGKAVIDVQKVAGSPCTLYGAYVQDNHCRNIPDPLLCSWEKAFYGVEEEQAFTDCRMDRRITLENNPPRLDDLSPSPGLQNGDYNVRLLLAPKATAGSRQHIALLKHVQPSEMSAAAANNGLQTNAIPSYAACDLWLIRLHGKVINAAGGKAQGLRLCIQSRMPDGTLRSYDTPWVPRRLRSGTDESFDVAFPLAPHALPGKICAIKLNCTAPIGSACNSSLQNTPHFDELYLDILQLPSLPFGTGHLLL